MLEKGAMAISGKQNVLSENLKFNVFRENFLTYVALTAEESEKVRAFIWVLSCLEQICSVGRMKFG